VAEVRTDDAIAKHLEAEGVDPRARPKAYSVKLFSKLDEAERWELQEDLIRSMMKEVWEKPDSPSYEIEQFKKKSTDFIEQFKMKTAEFTDRLLTQRKVTSPYSSPQVRRRKPSIRLDTLELYPEKKLTLLLLLFFVQQTQTLHYELNKTVAHQQRCLEKQADMLADRDDRISELESKLAKKQGTVTS
jgi:hypothetical protein